MLLSKTFWRIRTTSVSNLLQIPIKYENMTFAILYSIMLQPKLRFRYHNIFHTSWFLKQLFQILDNLDIKTILWISRIMETNMILYILTLGIVTLDLIPIIKLHGVTGTYWKFAIGLLNFRLTLQNNTIPVRKVTNQNSIVLSSQL